MAGLVAMLLALALAGCSDEGGTGTEDTCTGAGCGTSDVGDTGVGTDTSGGSDTTPTDTSVTTCSPGQVQCLDPQTLRLCVNGQWEETLCISSVCDPTAGACRAPACPVAGQPFQCESGSQERVCSADQLSYTLRDCEGTETCLATSCGVRVCSAGAKRCRSTSAPEQCNEDGSAWELLDACAENEVCSGQGVCQSLCEINEKTSSFLGCEYYVVDLDNASGSTDDQPFGVTVSNPSTTLTARVNIYGANQTVTRDVAPNGLELVQLPADTDVDNSGLFSGATFQVLSSIPVTVHQFNPLNGNGVFSNDASLLLPVNALGTEYLALDYPSTSLAPPTDDLFGGTACGDFLCLLSGGTCAGGKPYCVVPCNRDSECTSLDEGLTCGVAGTCETGGSTAYVDIVATEDGTTVTVTTPVAIPGSASFTGMQAGQTQTFTMNSGQLLHLLAKATLGSDISGLEIAATKPVAVFAGHVCTYIPDATAYCDHIEQQLLPVSTWGTRYVAAKSFPRGTEDDFWRIVAAMDATTVTLSPPQQGVTSVVLDRGEVLEVASQESFEVNADKKVLVGQFWAGSNYPGIQRTCKIQPMGGSCSSDSQCLAGCGGDFGCELAAFCNNGSCATGSGIGDPAYSLAVPVAQYRADYIVLTPVGYQKNYLTVIARRGGVPLLDGVPVDAAPSSATATPLNADWDVFRFPVSEGVHVLQDSSSFGVVAYGYNCDVSYAYPGGLNLEIIN